ncbi:hypothetical protein K431DRAFT_235253 [Polychaeton citri CBS 116435]|uniref:Rhodopsin domain-containing protein n=1 Tax=Polychaeton citri CBS 116435 TaxID=1314669 RepID=A0A9P4UK85_9PEZI|nr:hypothetical protein K431DRAFT_235253 [Polychaeton citri CBS 116435]
MSLSGPATLRPQAVSYEGFTDTGHQVVVWVLATVAILFCLARISIRLVVFRRLYFDDGFALLATALLIANSAVTQVMSPPMYELLRVSVGLETPTAAFFERASFYLKCQFTSTFLFWSCLWSVKACFLAFFYRLTENLLWPRRMWWPVVAFTLLAYIGCIITYPVSCTSFVLGQCQKPINVQRSLISLRFSTAVDILSDLFIIAIPLWLCWHVRISLKQKIGLFSVLGLGFVIVAFSIARIVVTYTDGVHPEITWLAMWSSIESSVAVIVASLVSFKVLLSERQRSSHTSSYNRRRSYQPFGQGSDGRPNDVILLAEQQGQKQSTSTSKTSQTSGSVMTTVEVQGG